MRSVSRQEQDRFSHFSLFPDDLIAVCDDALVMLKGDVSYKEIWVRDLKTGRERQLTALGRGFTIGDFDISPDGRELLFDRSRDESDVVLIERPK